MGSLDCSCRLSCRISGKWPPLGACRTKCDLAAVVATNEIWSQYGKPGKVWNSFTIKLELYAVHDAAHICRFTFWGGNYIPKTTHRCRVPAEHATRNSPHGDTGNYIPINVIIIITSKEYKSIFTEKAQLRAQLVWVLVYCFVCAFVLLYFG